MKTSKITQFYSDSSRFSKYEYGHDGSPRSDGFFHIPTNYFPSTGLSFDSGVLMQSRDISHDFERLVFTGENLTLFTFLTNAHYSTC